MKRALTAMAGAMALVLCSAGLASASPAWSAPARPGRRDRRLSAANCIAAGDWQPRSGVEKALAESWDGSTWTIMSTPAPSRSDSNLQAVSCPAAGQCTAVGNDYKGRYLTLAERWNGSTWRLQPTPPSRPGIRACKRSGARRRASAPPSAPNTIAHDKSNALAEGS